jgi:outer membrane lipoprotein-sorting protein
MMRLGIGFGRWGAAAMGIALALLQAQPAAAAEVRGIPLSPHQTELVAKAEAAINAIGTMRARFLQAGPEGEITEGAVYLSRPGKLRVVYDPPTPVLVVANGAYFTFVDTKLQQFSYMDIDNTPAGLLLKKGVKFQGGDVAITRIAEPPGITEISLVSKKDPAVGSLTLVFTTQPFALAQWRVTDAQGLTTSVTLQNIEMGVDLNRELFATPQPR